ncbi:MAG TPA: hypothetical protein VNR18_02810 [Hyphomicrobiales bacterium]|nr:hypothetical protein [Hyphomicrobiales bacterium]
MTMPRFLLCLLLWMSGASLLAQEAPDFTGAWVINDSLSDNTDKQVEAALRAAGVKIQRKLFDRRQDRYRGGPEDQELYDRISYDKVLNIRLEDGTYDFTYADDYVRPVYTDDRSRSISLNALDSVQDFSFAHWEGEVLEVEARPRDGGFANESYRLLNGGAQLEVRLYIRPRTFEAPIRIKRVYDRRPG